MNKDLRSAIIAGNWKMNKTPSEAAKLIEELKAAMPEPDCEVVVCVPAIDVPAVAEAIKGSRIHLGAQNVHFEPSGAFTGEISASMLEEMGVEYVIVGHSERRQYFGETNETVNLRAKAAIAAGLTPIICVGETLEQREQGITDDLISMQTKIAFNGIAKEDAINCVIAYEPVWAIGTGKTATAEQANEVCQLIRDTIGVLYDDETADGISIQYGGSMNAKNCAELLAMEDIDGGLIGGASLKAPDFSVIIDAASK
ncbi:MAG: triose-phosphate isomerase [Clostridia bacterium]|nr:triose-phosphate isomerase [Clostridia bacterium]